VVHSTCCRCLYSLLPNGVLQSILI
jgi:hypothetical protein